jgi:hypothetical protein
MCLFWAGSVLGNRDWKRNRTVRQRRLILFAARHSWDGRAGGPMGAVISASCKLRGGWSGGWRTQDAGTIRMTLCWALRQAQAVTKRKGSKHVEPKWLNVFWTWNAIDRQNTLWTRQAQQTTDQSRHRIHTSKISVSKNTQLATVTAQEDRA